MHPQLINMDLQEGMVFKDIYCIHLHTPKHLQKAMKVYLTNIYTTLMKT
jgi:hypothetical protein